MMKRIAVGVGMLVAVLLLATVAVGGVIAQTEQPTNETTERNNASFGATVSSFMQASSAEAEGEVDDGMFEASLSRAESLEERRTLLEERQERLEERKQRLANRRADFSTDGEPDVRSRAVATHVSAGASELEQSVNRTEHVAREVGVDTARLEQIRTEARNLSGTEVAELARGLAGPPGGERGRPETPGNGDAETLEGAENGTDVSIGVSNISNGGGPPIDVGDGNDAGGDSESETDESDTDSDTTEENDDKSGSEDRSPGNGGGPGGSESDVGAAESDGNDD
jgi:hypothetical protein